MSSQESGSSLASGSGYSKFEAPVSTTMVVGEGAAAEGVVVEEVLRLVEMVGEGREVVGLRVLRSLVLVFFSTRQLGRALDASGGYEGRRVFTILPLASRQSLFLVASTPKPSPPASSSFSLWRAMCLSVEAISHSSVRGEDHRQQLT